MEKFILSAKEVKDELNLKEEKDLYRTRKSKTFERGKNRLINEQE